MSSELAMSVMAATELVLSLALAFLFFKKKLQHRFPAMSGYLVLRAVSTPVLFVLLSCQTQSWGKAFVRPYFFTYWGVYIASAVLIFCVCVEVYRAALSGFPGLVKLGSIAFSWAALVSLLVSLSTVSFHHMTMMRIPHVAFSMMRSVSILELCLLAFLCIAMNALSLSPRDISFGIALGFGLMASNDFIVVSMLSSHASLTTPLQFLYQSVVLVSLGTWGLYFALPEPARKPVLVAANSAIYRWNEIASALGHSGTKVAVAQPANAFFLTDVERVVERVLARNMKGSESES
jgi:hypothetical protein